MRKLALWASLNPRRARFYIIALHLVLGILAYFLARLLQVSVFMQDLLLFCAIAYFLLLVWIYPDQKKPMKFEFLKSFAFRKICDFSVALCSFIVIFCFDSKIFNPSPIVPYSYAASNATIFPKPKKPNAQEVLSSLQYRDKSTLTRQEKKVLRKEFKKQLKNFVVLTVTGKKEQSNKALYIILTIVGALGVLAIISAIACELSCNGMESASAVVLILGLIGVIIGVVLIIRRINRGPKKKPEEMAPKETI